MMKKQICAVLLILSMVTCLFAGCVTDSQPALAWAAEGLAAVLPQLEAKSSTIITNTADNFAAEVGGLTLTQFKSFLAACKAVGLNKVAVQYDNAAVLSNKDGNMVTLRYQEAEQKMSVDLYSATVLPGLNYDVFLRNNTNGAYIVSDLKLPAKFTDKETDTTMQLTWTCSMPSMISEKGVVVRPTQGDMDVVLTATDENGAKKSFLIRIIGMNCNDGALVVNQDYIPATGSGVASTLDNFTFNTQNNSIIKDMGETTRVNYVKLTDSDNEALLGTEFMTLWVSDDNVTYTQVKDYRLLHDGVDWYLYDFEAEARYVKAHYTLLTNKRIPSAQGTNAGYETFAENPAEFKNVLGKMISAGYEEIFGANGAEFTKLTHTVTNNTDNTWFDHAWTISMAAAGITGEPASLRISANGKALFHYVDGDNLIVRIPDLEKGASLTLDILQSNSKAPLNLADKEGVYEVVYGVREITSNVPMGAPHYAMYIPKGTVFPAGNVLEEDMLIGFNENKVLAKSTDGGYTWTQLSSSCHYNKFIYDEVSHRLFAGIIAKVGTGDWGEAGVTSKMVFGYSDDGGITWKQNAFEFPIGLSTYEAGITTKTSYDGDGPGVDLVMPVAGYKGVDVYGGLGVRVMYSCDAGKTWNVTDWIQYDDSGEYEGDVSEATIVEREDGLLVLQSRNQHDYTRTLAVAFSIDHGKTWTTQAELSNVYSSNTQPVARRFEVAGEEALMLSWASHNVMGNTKFIRNPMNIGVSTNGGETYRNIQNVFARSPFEKWDYIVYATQQSFEKAGEDDAYIGFMCTDLKPDMMAIRIQDFDNWFTRTKGAYDSFENGSPLHEGWVMVNGAVIATDEKASAGNYCMELRRNPIFMRSIPYLQNGSISFDLFVDEETELTLELQAALCTFANNDAAPIAFTVKDKKLTFVGGEEAITLKDGWNNLCFNLELTEDKATFSLNGAEDVAIPVDLDIGDFITYIGVFGKSSVFIDELLVQSTLNVVLTATQEDKDAANVVIEQIKNMDANDATAVKAARDAFEALTQVQRDLVDSKVIVDPNGDVNKPGTIVDYYDVLVEAEAKLAG